MNEQKTTYGIIGYPVTYSLSPFMHNTAFRDLEVDAVYEVFPLQENELDPFFKDLRKEDSPIFGLNVTVPYKEKVIEYMDSMTPFAEKARAVNTVVISEDRKLTGYNTDGPGFLAHLNELQFDVSNKRITILGAGGTTRAVLTALCLLPEQPESIRLYNRTPSKAELLVKDLSQRMKTERVRIVSSVDDLNIELSDFLINTTSVGMGDSEESLVEAELIHSNMLVYDVIYDPKETPLLRMARERGARTVNGFGLLYYQGVLAFQHWADMELEPAVKDKMRQSLEAGKIL